MPVVVNGAEELKQLVGKSLGASSWLTIEQERIQLFADATGDHQWIHTDPERAAKESPYGKPIAHGYLTLSIIPIFFFELLEVKGVKMAVNYGLDKLRFPAPVPVGSRVRGSFTIAGVDEVPGGLQLRAAGTVEIEGGTKPVCIAEVLYRYYF